MLTARWNTSVVSPSTWLRMLTVSDDNGPIDLSGYTAEFVVYDSAGNHVITLTDGDGITLGGTAGTIALAAQSEGVEPGCYQHYLKLTIGEGVTDPTVGQPTVWVVAIGQFGVN